MASLTPLSKGLIGLAVVGAMASAVWHLGLKEKVQDAMGTAPPTTEAPAVQATPPAAPAVVTTQAPATTRPQSTPLPANTAPASASGMTAADNAEAGRKLLESGNPAQARIHLEQAVQGGDASAACLLGEMTLKGQGGLVANHDKAAALFQLAQSRNTICFASGQ
ncbi:MAG: hypothetical protein KA173_11320 [Rhodoferax sp.]|nr:hypothetical protein [Rhodoferax sp.]MBP7493258.1 hypothetical protein [Rhodoferax sp.]